MLTYRFLRRFNVFGINETGCVPSHPRSLFASSGVCSSGSGGERPFYSSSLEDGFGGSGVSGGGGVRSNAPLKKGE